MHYEVIGSIFTNKYLPLGDVGWYALMIVADILIVRFWWFVMKRLGDR
jgi:hypothetical protein